MSHQIVAMIIPLVFLCHLGFVLTEVCNGQNEVFSDCGGCDQQCGGTGSACGESCVRGCFCMEGFKRNFEGKCVEESQCFVCPGINEYFTTCGNKCTEQCNKSYEICSDQCQVGCFCKSGYKRNARGECVSPEHCCCDPNEEFKYGNECIEKCGATICTMGLTQGCFCKSGYKRELRTKKCIPECQCPKGSTYCGYLEEYKCSNKCKDLIDLYGFRQYCKMDCYFGCFCKTGYARDPNTDQCVLEPPCTKTYNRYYS